MDTFVDSCWYYFRYCDPRNDRAPFDWTKASPWFPVGLYIGGIEHATMHLIYTRFFTKVMRDLGLVTIDEPVSALFTQGMVVKDGAKMSKSRGTSSIRTRWSSATAPTRRGCSRSSPRPRSAISSGTRRVWKGASGSSAGCGGRSRRRSRCSPPRERAAPGRRVGEALALRRKTHQTIRRVTDDLGPRMHLNTPVAAIMELLNLATPLVSAETIGEGEAWAVREAFESRSPGSRRRSRRTSRRSCGRAWVSSLRRHDGMAVSRRGAPRSATRSCSSCRSTARCAGS